MVLQRQRGPGGGVAAGEEVSPFAFGVVVNCSPETASVTP